MRNLAVHIQIQILVLVKSNLYLIIDEVIAQQKAEGLQDTIYLMSWGVVNVDHELQFKNIVSEYTYPWKSAWLYLCIS